MAYKIKRRKTPKPAYFRERELRDIRKEYKGKLPPFKRITITGARRTAGFYKRVYKKGKIVEYDNGLARVERVSKRGIHVRQFKRDKEGFLTKLDDKQKFISVMEIDKGKVQPTNTNFPLLPVIPFTMDK